MPASKPLQVFLLCAFVLTGLTYLANMRAQSIDDYAFRVTAARIRRLVFNQDNYLSHSRYGFQAIERNHYDLAAFHFRAALVTADTAEGHYNLATVFLRQGKFDPAVEEFKAALHLNPKSTAVYKAWGLALISQNKPVEAASLFKQGLQYYPDDALIHYDLGRAYEAQKNPSEASLEYNQAAKLGLASADFLLHQGGLLMDQGKLADAESDLAKAVALKPDIADAQFKLAFVLQQQHQYAEAIKHYEAMLTITPDHPETLNNMALIYATADDPQIRSPKMAVMLATRASTATGDENSRYMDTLARGYAADGDFSHASFWENKAMRRAEQLGEQDLLKEFTSRSSLFQQQKAQ